MAVNEPAADAGAGKAASRVRIGLAAANVVAGVAAAVMGWNVFTLVMLYWLEEGVAGLFAVVKLYRAQRLGVLGSRTYKILFFIAHYATYCVLHLAVLFAVLNPESRVWTLDLLWFAALVGLVAVHVWSYFREYKGEGEYAIIPANVSLFSIYGRVAPGQMAVLLLIAVLPTPEGGGTAAMTLLFIAIAKTLLDALGHYWEHSVLPSKYRMGRVEQA